MGLDIRFPIGLMFTLVGILLEVAGFAYDDPETLHRSLGINVNLWWGLGLIIFGALMLGFAIRGARKAPPPDKS